MQDVPVGTHVYTLRGQDPEGSPVTYTISGDVFSADRSATSLDSYIRSLTLIEMTEKAKEIFKHSRPSSNICS